MATLIHQSLLALFSLALYGFESRAQDDSSAAALSRRTFVVSAFLCRPLVRSCSSSLSRAPLSHKPWREYVILALCVVTLRGTINFGLKFIDFNTKVRRRVVASSRCRTASLSPSQAPQTIFQSARPVPVMLAGVMFGTKFDALDYAVTALLCVGLICFTQADAQSSLGFSAVGRPLRARARAATSRATLIACGAGVALMALSVSADALRLTLSERVLNSKLNARSVGELVRRHFVVVHSIDMLQWRYVFLAAFNVRTFGTGCFVAACRVERRAASGRELLCRQRRRVCFILGERRRRGAGGGGGAERRNDKKRSWAAVRSLARCR